MNREEELKRRSSEWSARGFWLEYPESESGSDGMAGEDANVLGGHGFGPERTRRSGTQTVAILWRQTAVDNPLKPARGVSGWDTGASAATSDREQDLRRETREWSAGSLWTEYETAEAAGDGDLGLDYIILPRHGYERTGTEYLPKGWVRVRWGLTGAARHEQEKRATSLSASSTGPTSTGPTCAYCQEHVDRVDRYCRWCGTRLASSPPPGDWSRQPRAREGYGSCPLGIPDGVKSDALMEQHNHGRPYVSAILAEAHAKFCPTFAGVVQAWPPPSAATAELALRGQSELFACGYRITGLTREQRWRTLSEVAIPRLGRNQVIVIIESLIRLREAQDRDYSHAIGEWEYDLWRLGR